MLKTLIRYTQIIWVIKVPTENDMVYFIHTQGIDDHGYDGCTNMTTVH